ncbi:type II secretion system F family protein [Patescibacteria group bacterium]|nr:type II secretion system F family protein [Patescibacteria group bacterium]
MLFKYKATTTEGEVKEGQMDAATFEIALRSLQKRNLIIITLEPVKSGADFFKKDLFSFERIKNIDIVIFSRQVATLFEAKVPALTSFELLAAETESPALKRYLAEVVDDIKGGLRISEAIAKHPKLFSEFYVNMVKSGEESGKLEEVFKYLADYLERSHELSSKAVRALVYPAFVLFSFFAVLVLMLVFVIPQLASIIEESGQQDVPIYTGAVIWVSGFLTNYGALLLVFLVAGVVLFWRYSKTKDGKMFISQLQISVPYIGTLYRNLYVSRITDNLQTLFSGGVSMLRSLDITSGVIGNHVYKLILMETKEAVKGGGNISESFSRFEQIPRLASHMIKIGEETGKLNFILKMLADFYRKEVDQSLEMLISMLEPLMTIVLGVVVALLLASVLVPIYNIAMSV